MRSFGPVINHNQDDGTMRATCWYCIFLSRHHDGNKCRYSGHGKRDIPDPDNTPDWCDMRAGMLRDAKDMAAGIEHKVVRWSGRRTDDPRVIYCGVPSEAKRQFTLAAREAKRGTVQLMNEQFEELLRHPSKEAAQ